MIINMLGSQVICIVTLKLPSWSKVVEKGLASEEEKKKTESFISNPRVSLVLISTAKLRSVLDFRARYGCVREQRAFRLSVREARTEGVCPLCRGQPSPDVHMLLKLLSTREGKNQRMSLRISGFVRHISRQSPRSLRSAKHFLSPATCLSCIPAFA